MISTLFREALADAKGFKALLSMMSSDGKSNDLWVLTKSGTGPGDPGTGADGTGGTGGGTAVATSDSITLTWAAANPPPQGYQIFRSTDGPGRYDPDWPLTDFPVQATTFTDTAVNQGTTYYYTIFPIYQRAEGQVKGQPTYITSTTPVPVPFRIVLTIDVREARVGPNVVTLDVAPLIQNNRTLVPLRFIGESLGATIAWDGTERKVTYTRGETAEPGVPRDMVVKDGIAYIPDEWGLQLIDVTDLRSPARLSFIDLHTGPPGMPATVGIDVQGSVAYVAQSEGGLIMVDVADPRTPHRLATHRSPELIKVMSVAVAGGVAYLGDHGRLHVVDVSDPRTPRTLSTLTVPGIIDGTALAGETLAMAGGAPGVQRASLAQPRTPALAGPLYVPGYALEVAVQGELALAAAEDGGLFVLATGAAVAAGSARNHASVAAGEARRDGAPPLSAADGAGSRSTDGAAVAAPPPPPGKTCTVASTADAGPGTLRQCLATAAVGDRITFPPAVFPSGRPAAIRLASALPQLRQGHITIDASKAGVVLDGSAAPAGTAGIVIRSHGNVVRGLQVVGFPADGISIVEARDNIIGGSRARGSSPLGQGNRISGNGGGVSIVGDAATGNRLLGNLIGTDLGGGAAAGNGIHGVHISGGARGNQVGGTGPGEGNLISGNGWVGVTLLGAETEGNLVIGNTIGLDASGTRTLGHVESGVVIAQGASGNRIGGDGPGERNRIAGLHLFNIAEPARPRPLAQLTFGKARPRALAVRGDQVYVATQESSLTRAALEVIDVRDPAQPRTLGRYAFDGMVDSVAVLGEYAFAAGGGRLRSFDIRSPAAPRELAATAYATTTGSGQEAVAVRPGYAYVATPRPQLLVYDIADPAKPALQGQYTPAEDLYAGYDLAVEGDGAYLAYTGGLLALDVRDPRTPARAGLLTGSGISGRSVAATGGYVYVGGGQDVVILPQPVPAGR